LKAYFGEKEFAAPLATQVHCARRNVSLHELNVADERRRLSRFGRRNRA
jgi:hypothetical protein